MSDSDSELDEIRREKLRELQEREEQDEESGSSGSPDEPIHVEDTAGIEEFTASHDVVLVDYYADWCGPCKQLEPVVEEIAATTDAAVLKVDIDDNPGLASAGNVRGVPTLVLFVDGDPAERLVGYQNEGQLRSVIEQHAGS